MERKIFRQQRVLWLTLGLLALVEGALEVRAAARGWNTVLFGQADTRPAASNGVVSPFGPTESFPFRSRIVQQTKPAETFRIWIASASHAQDVRVSAGEVFPNQLDRMLNEAGHRVEVLNASWAGHGIPANIAELRTLSDAWQPDIAILYQMSQEINRLAPMLLERGSSPEQLRPAATQGGGEDPQNGGISRLAEETTIYEVLRGNLTSRVTQQRLLHEHLDDAVVEEYERLVNEFADQAEASGLTPVLCTFATSHDRRHLGTIPSDFRASFFLTSQHLSVAGWLSVMERMNARLRAIAEERGLLLVDLNAQLGGKPELFRNWVHFNPEGHRAAAAAIMNALSDVLPQQPSAGPGQAEEQ
jgi:hypothetical protein